MVERISVKLRYADDDHRQLLRSGLKADFKSRRTKIGTRKFVEDILIPTVERNIERIVVEGDQRFRPNFAPLFDNHKLTQHFLSDNFEGRKFNDNLLRIVDAYLQITVRGFDAVVQSRDTADEVGMVLGEFLRDETALKDRYKLALSQQALLGIYRYGEVDTHRYHINDARYLAMFSGRNPDYISLIDINAQNLTAGPRRVERLKVYSGFCIPGEDFSPILMRTLCFRRRHVGLLYTPGSLIDASGGPLDELTYEVFTTEKEALSSKKTSEKYGSAAFAKALDIHYGPKKRRTLTKLSKGAELNEIERRFELFRREMV